MLIIAIQVDTDNALHKFKAKEVKDAISKSLGPVLGDGWRVFAHPEAAVVHCLQKANEVGADAANQNQPSGLIQPD